VRIAYLDCFSGIAGDMTLGACIDAGVSPELIEDPLRELLPGLSLEVEQVRKSGVRAMSVHVKAERTSVLRTALNIRSLLERAEVTDRARRTALAIFDRLCEAEAHVHGTEINQLVLHELGEPDTIADILGAAISFDALGIDEVQASPIATGIGMARGEHGLYPIPGPAVTELLKGVPIYSRGVPYELVTPTGAAIVAATAVRYGDPPAVVLTATGYGAGDRDLEHPNVLRLMIGEVADRRTATPTEAAIEPILILETTVDDLDAEAIGFVCEEARRLGAHDAYAIPATMKKGRPGAVLTILAPPEREATLRDLLFTQTTTLGVRRRSEHRYVLDRETTVVDVDGHEIRVKLARDAKGRLLHASPEHDDCAAAARALGLPLATIRSKAVAVARA
jgi:uncharacterized protein (TIGR00299 family) protein